jgi:Tfp pilus assembly PilM family ATPase/Tfp pilus assembly protein PilN
LDLNDSGICWVELRKDKSQGLVLERCFFEPLAPGCIVDGQILEFAEVQAALTRLLSGPDAGLLPRVLPPLAMALPAVLVTTERVSFPAKLSDAVLAERVHAEMAARMRLKDDAVFVDFVAGPSGEVGKKQHAAKTDLIAAAVPGEAIEDRLALVEGAGLPWRVDLMALASQAAVSAVCRGTLPQAGRPDAVMALVQVEASWLQLDIVRQAEVLHSERFKLAVTNSPEPRLELPDGLFKALEAASGSATSARPLRLWLAGPAKLLVPWGDALRARTGLPCSLVNPFEGLAPGASLNGKHRLGAAQALVACGLARMALGDETSSQPATELPRFNFLPHRKTAFLRRQKNFLTQLAAVALSVLLASAVLRVVLSERLQTQQEAQAEVREDIAGLDAELKRLSGAAAELERLQRYQDVLTAFARSRQQTPLMWQELSTLMPDGLHLTGLRKEAEGAVILSGQARSAAEVFALIERLSAGSQHVKRPELLDLSLVAEAAALQAGAPAILAGTIASGAAPVASSQASSVERVVFTLRAQQR